MRSRIFIPLSLLALLLGWILSSFSAGKQPETVVDVTADTSLSKHLRNTEYVRVFDVTLKSNTHYKSIDFGFVYTSFMIELLEGYEMHGLRYV